MKKIFLFAAAAAMLTACSSEEQSSTEIGQNSEPAPVAFSIYTPRSVTRAGLPEELTTPIVGNGQTNSGFGVFAYYTNGEKDYAAANTFPNFMYNQQVKGDGNNPVETWKYEPVKYWPNEYGSTASSDDVERVSFFAYAPWVKVDYSTGVPEGVSEEEKNITALTKNTDIGDPMVYYTVDTEPKTSVDLLWGVFYDGEKNYVTKWGTNETSVKPYAPFIDLMKPNYPYTGGTIADGTYDDSKIVFNLRHALAKLNVTIDYIDDAATPDGPAAKTLNPDETRIYVREIKIGGFVMKGALNLNNKKNPSLYTAGNAKDTPIPNWKAPDGTSELDYDDVVKACFKDGRRDDKEGAADGGFPSEKNLGLNPKIIENPTSTSGVWPAGKTDGVTATTVNLFGDGNSDADKPIFVIPVNKKIDVEIIYDVETANPKLFGTLSDGLTHGLSIENKIKKTSAEIFGTETTMQAGIGYTLNIHLGMTSVKVDASVNPWGDDTKGNADLPDNQPMP